jgi:ribosomal protein S18 acetylase RimI-like enzyme
MRALGSAKTAMSDVSVKKLTIADVELCGDLMRALPDWFGIEEAIGRYEADLRSLDGFAAWDDNRMVGFVGLKRYGVHAVEINVIAVHPDYRRQGIGSHLLRMVEAHAVTSDTKFLHTKTVAPSRPNAAYAESREFWRAHGFIPMDEHDLWGSENLCLVLVRVLK